MRKTKLQWFVGRLIYCLYHMEKRVESQHVCYVTHQILQRSHVSDCWFSSTNNGSFETDPSDRWFQSKLINNRNHDILAKYCLISVSPVFQSHSSRWLKCKGFESLYQKKNKKSPEEFEWSLQLVCDKKKNCRVAFPDNRLPPSQLLGSARRRWLRDRTGHCHHLGVNSCQFEQGVTWRWRVEGSETRGEDMTRPHANRDTPNNDVEFVKESLTSPVKRSLHHQAVYGLWKHSQMTYSCGSVAFSP